MDKLVLNDWIWPEDKMNVEATPNRNKCDYDAVIEDVVIDVVNTKFIKDPIETSISLSLSDAQRLRDYLTDFLKEIGFEA